jgi:hypothetical protein
MPPSNRPRPHLTPVPSPAPPPPGRARVPVAARRADRAAREQERWDAKYARAVTPAQKAAVDFDRVRAAIKDLERRDPPRAAALWNELSAILTRLRDVSCRDVTPRRR